MEASQKPYRISNPEGIYFLSFATVYWLDVFTRSVYREIVVNSLRYCQENKGLQLHAWCLMSNHVHLIASAEPGFRLSDILRDFKKFTSKTLLKAIQEETESRKEWMLWLMARAAEKNKRNEQYQFWRQDNHAEELITRPFMRQKLDYLHNNPVTAGWVDAPEDYPHSSARDYFGAKTGVLNVLMLDC